MFIQLGNQWHFSISLTALEAGDGVVAEKSSRKNVFSRAYHSAVKAGHVQGLTDVQCKLLGRNAGAAAVANMCS